MNPVRHRSLWVAAIVMLATGEPAHAQCVVAELVGTLPQDIFSGGPSPPKTTDEFVVGRDGGGVAGGEHVIIYRKRGTSWVESANLHPTDDGSAPLNGAIALDGHVFIAAGSGAMGRVVSVHRFDGLDWILEATLTPPAETPAGNFGDSVDIDGDTIVIGAPQAAVAGMASAGAAFVFRHDERGWHQEAKLVHPSPAAQDHLATRVAVSGDVILLNSTGEDAGALNAGAMLVYRAMDSEWMFEQMLLPQHPQSGDGFANSIALAGDVALAGASHHNNNKGAVHVFHDLGGSWIEQAMLGSGLPGNPGVQFGVNVAISSDADTIVASSPIAPSELRDSEGAAFVFVRSANVWLPASILGPTEPGQDGYGASPTIGDDGLAFRSFGPFGASATHVVRGLSGADCDANGEPDACEIASGAALDIDQNGVPDSCQLPADLTADGVVDGADMGLLLSLWSASGDDADLNGDGIVDGADLGLLLGDWGNAIQPVPCAGTSDCCAPSVGGGCGDAECCAMVCPADPYCCQSAWDHACVGLAQQLCGCAAPQTCGIGEDCCAPHEGPGCADPTCCQAVCALDVFCCEATWDVVCQGEAQLACGCPPLPFGTCTPDNPNDCCSGRASNVIGCNDVACCTLLCNVDGFCCMVVWDAICASEALELCEICQDPPP